MTYKAQSRVCGHSTLCDELPLHPCSVPRCPLLPELWAKAQYFERGYWKKTKKHMSVPTRINLPYGHKRPNSLMSKPWRWDREKSTQSTLWQIPTGFVFLTCIFIFFLIKTVFFRQLSLPSPQSTVVLVGQTLLLALGPSIRPFPILVTGIFHFLGQFLAPRWCMTDGT